MKLEIFILTQNNESSIAKTIESLKPLQAKIIIGDIGSIDDTLKICKNYNLEINELNFENDYSKAKNKLILIGKDHWILCIEPWEILISGHDEILKIANSNAVNSYHFQVFSNSSVNKEIKFWNRSKNLNFINPVYETVSDVSDFVDASIISINERPRNNQTILKQWMDSSPLSAEPIYYQACEYLNNGKYKEFITMAERYLFLNKIGISACLMNYYLSLVEFYVNKNESNSIRRIMSCISQNPIMAEFWCVLGDIYLKNKHFDKAISFYENAIILGSRRLRNDMWPIEINKYQNYPNKQIKMCEELLKEVKSFSK